MSLLDYMSSSLCTEACDSGYVWFMIWMEKGTLTTFQLTLETTLRPNYRVLIEDDDQPSMTRLCSCLNQCLPYPHPRCLIRFLLSAPVRYIKIQSGSFTLPRRKSS